MEENPFSRNLAVERFEPPMSAGPLIIQQAFGPPDARAKIHETCVLQPEGRGYAKLPRQGKGPLSPGLAYQNVLYDKAILLHPQSRREFWPAYIGTCRNGAMHGVPPSITFGGFLHPGKRPVKNRIFADGFQCRHGLKTWAVIVMRRWNNGAQPGRKLDCLPKSLAASCFAASGRKGRCIPRQKQPPFGASVRSAGRDAATT